MIIPLRSKCAVIIVTWNSWHFLFKCLAAVERQTYKDFHIIILNNGESPPEQEEKLTQFAHLTYVKNTSNLGFAAANNKGLDLAKNCKWVALLNPDTEPEADWLEKMIEVADNNPRGASFGCRIQQANNPLLLDGEGDHYHISGFAWRVGMGLTVPHSTPKTGGAFSACAAAALYRRDALLSVGGFDEDFFCYMEDVDLGFRLRLRGWQCLTVSGAEVLHVGSGSTGKRSPFYVYYGQRNIVWAYVKNMPGFLFWLFLPLHLLLNIAGLLRYSLTGRLKVVLRAKYDAFIGLPLMWRKRRNIQEQRVVTVLDILSVLDKRPVPGLGRSFRSLWT